MQLHLQTCSVDDLNLLTHISRKTFIDAFEKDNDRDDFEAYMDYAFAEPQLLKELKNPDTSFYFVFKEDDLCGYFKLNENESQTDVKSSEAIELERIYVLESFQGQQIGKWILDEVKKIASFKQKKILWLGVWQKNSKAVKFYKNHGFSKFGTHPYFIGNDQQTDWLMRIELNKR